MPKHNAGSSDSTIVGTSQGEQIFGTSGADYIQGRAGGDYINGGAGDDTLSGGAGQDQFALNPGGGHDLVTDYQTGEMLFFNFGMFTNNPGNPIHTATPGALFVGEQFATMDGHVMTVGQTAAGDTTLTWDTGDSLTLQGVHADAVSSAVFQFYPTGWSI